MPRGRDVILSDAVLAVAIAAQRAMLAMTRARHGGAGCAERLAEAKRYARAQIEAIDLAERALVSVAPEIDLDSARALVEAGYMPLAHYLDLKAARDAKEAAA